MALSGFALYRDVILPGALPSILVGVRFALGLMWVMLIVAETISAQSGIGYMTMNAREFLQTDVVRGRHPALCAARQARRHAREGHRARLRCAGIRPIRREGRSDERDHFFDELRRHRRRRSRSRVAACPGRVARRGRRGALAWRTHAHGRRQASGAARTRGGARRRRRFRDRTAQRRQALWRAPRAVELRFLDRARQFRVDRRTQRLRKSRRCCVWSRVWSR